jgi:hypothetical protein
MPGEGNFLVSLYLLSLELSLQCSMSVKYLGVVLGSRLTWREHVNTKVNKAYNLLRTYVATWVLRHKVVYWIYVSIIRTSVAFASLVWRPGCQKVSANKRLSRI